LKGGKTKRGNRKEWRQEKKRDLREKSIHPPATALLALPQDRKRRRRSPRRPRAQERRKGKKPRKATQKTSQNHQVRWSHMRLRRRKMTRELDRQHGKKSMKLLKMQSLQRRVLPLTVANMAKATSGALPVAVAVGAAPLAAVTVAVTVAVAELSGAQAGKETAATVAPVTVATAEAGSVAVPVAVAAAVVTEARALGLATLTHRSSPPLPPQLLWQQSRLQLAMNISTIVVMISRDPLSPLSPTLNLPSMFLFFSVG
jgi:hypothetical protein